jgi:arylsulfatase A-like enzyme
VHINVLNSDLAQVNLADPVAGFAGMPRNITALPQMLKDVGYHTVQAGKCVHNRKSDGLFEARFCFFRRSACRRFLTARC